MRRFARTRLVVALCLVSLLGNVAPARVQAQDAPACSLSVPSMSGLQMTPPPDGLDPTLAGFLGAWEGNWETAPFPPLPSRLVVHRIDASTSAAFYAWGTDGASMQPGSGSMNLQVDGKTLRTGTDIKFAFTINDDGSSIEGVRETSRGLVSRITMTRCTLAASAPMAPAAQQPQPIGASQSADAPPCILNDKFVPVSGQTGKPFSETLTMPAVSDLQAKYLGAWQGSMNDETVRLVIFATNRLQYTWASMNPGDDATAYSTFQVDANGNLSWKSGQAFTYSATRQEDGSLKLHLVRGNGSEAEGVLTACGV